MCGLLIIQVAAPMAAPAKGSSLISAEWISFCVGGFLLITAITNLISVSSFSIRLLSAVIALIVHFSLSHLIMRLFSEVHDLAKMVYFVIPILAAAFAYGHAFRGLSRCVQDQRSHDKITPPNALTGDEN
jgi:hypothetical protein